MRTRAKTLGQFCAKLNAAFRFREGQLLSIGIGHHKLNTLKARLDHIIDRIATCAADAEHDNTRL
jgi:hypothetical protein